MRFRRLNLPGHGAIELATGIAMMLAPGVLQFGAAGLVASALLGAVLVGVSLGLNAAPTRAAISRHQHFDSLFLLATALAAFVLAVAGELGAGLFLAVVVGVQASLAQLTRYAMAG
jgi:hypothetical protein